MVENTEAWTIYEQPLSERVRTLLRLEHLFDRAHAYSYDCTQWSSRGAIEALIDVLSVIGRTDIRKELIKEFERHLSTFEALQSHPKVDSQRLESVLGRIHSSLDSLRASEGGFGSEFRNNELIHAVRQRSSMPAGTCDFDLPAYHYWLTQPDEVRQNALVRWQEGFGLLRDCVSLNLNIVRQSGTASKEWADGGFFQRSLESNTPCQMIRVSLPSDLPVFPEISAGRHRFTVRFMSQEDTGDRPTQLNENIEFALTCCFV